jgi:hypothetical protein
MAVDKVFYNEGSAAKLGWDPSWFGADDFDDDLVKKISLWQKKLGLKADGMCGPTTYRRIYAERESNIDDYIPYKAKEKDAAYIVHKGNFMPINWKKVVLWSDNDGLKTSGKYRAQGTDRKPNLFVTHWDACLTSESCAKVLGKRGLSVHFCIDNDGTIYQLLDTNHIAYHAGKHNTNSIGVEISNAYYTRYQDWYVRKGFGERPMMEGVECQGSKLEPFLGFYDVQIQALTALYEAIHKGLGIDLKCPTDDNGNTLTKVSSAAAANRFNGFVSHYHLTRKKIDCAGLDIQKLLNQIK